MSRSSVKDAFLCPADDVRPKECMTAKHDPPPPPPLRMCVSLKTKSTERTQGVTTTPAPQLEVVGRDDGHLPSPSGSSGGGDEDDGDVCVFRKALVLVRGHGERDDETDVYCWNLRP